MSYQSKICINQFANLKLIMKKYDVLTLDGKLLTTFLAVFEAQSVTKAADALGTSQSAVSHSLERLRECIGDPLFVKSGRGIVSTNTAARLAPKISMIVCDIEGLALQSEYDPKFDETPFTVATNVTELLPLILSIKQAVRGYSDVMPLRFIDLGPRTNALEFLNSGKADVVIAVSIGPYPLELKVERLHQDQIVCFFDPLHRAAPKTIEEYCSARHAVVDFGGKTKSMVDTALENSGHTRKVFLSCSNSYAVSRLATGTDLVATLPKRLLGTAFEGFSWSELPIPLPKVSYDLVWHRRMGDSSRHVWIRNVLRGL